MKKIIWTLASLIVAVFGVYFFNYFTLTKPVLEDISKDVRNNGIEIGLHFKNYISTKTLVFDLKKIPADKAIADVFRVLLQTSSVLKDKNFENVELSYNGKSKFMLKGDYFSELGKEYEDQNPMYTMRTFPEHIYDMNGKTVYTGWDGGVLGVLTNQIEDFKDFNSKWYLENN